MTATNTTATVTTANKRIEHLIANGKSVYAAYIGDLHIKDCETNTEADTVLGNYVYDGLTHKPITTAPCTERSAKIERLLYDIAGPMIDCRWRDSEIIAFGAHAAIHAIYSAFTESQATISRVRSLVQIAPDRWAITISAA